MSGHHILSHATPQPCARGFTPGCGAKAFCTLKTPRRTHSSWWRERKKEYADIPQVARDVGQPPLLGCFHAPTGWRYCLCQLQGRRGARLDSQHDRDLVSLPRGAPGVLLHFSRCHLSAGVPDGDALHDRGEEPNPPQSRELQADYAPEERGAMAGVLRSHHELPEPQASEH